HKSYIHNCHPEWNDDAKIAFVLGHPDNTRTLSNLWRYQAQWERAIRTANQELRRIRKEAKQPKPAEVEEIKAPAVQIGFASQKPEEAQKQEKVKNPAEKKFGFPPKKKPTVVSPTSKIKHPTSGMGFASKKSAPQPKPPIPNTQYPIPDAH